MTKTNSPGLNTFRFIGSITGLFALVVQLYLIIINVHPGGPGYLQETIRFFSYMTIWTNILVAGSFFFPLFFPASRLSIFLTKPIVEGGILVYIFVVMLINHLFLQGLVNQTGMQWVVNLFLHYIIPVFYIAFWILYGKKGRQEYSNSIRWLIYPFIYILYSLARGALINQYPYPFIDVTELGYALALRNTVLIIVAYLIVGLMLVIIDKRLTKSELVKEG